MLQLTPNLPEFNQTQTSKRSTYRKKVAAAKRASTGPGGPDVSMSMLSTQDTEGHDGDEESRAAKKARIDGGAEGESRMEMDEQDASDAETIPDEVVEEDETEEEEEVEEEEEEEEDEEREDGEGEERQGTEDEALDEEDSE